MSEQAVYLATMATAFLVLVLGTELLSTPRITSATESHDAHPIIFFSHVDPRPH